LKINKDITREEFGRPSTREQHGESQRGKRSRLYSIWADILKRCQNINSQAYPNYGGRGIKVCDEWSKSFIAFRDWSLSNKYADNLEIDRIDNNGDYCPSNCRWTTRLINSRNKRSNRILEVNGEKQPLQFWAEKLGVPHGTIQKRINRGWSVEDAVSIASKKRT